PSAARVSSTDSANLLVAIAGGPISGASVKETKATYDSFGPLRALKKNKPGNFPRLLKSQYPTMGRLSRGHTLAEAITTVIDTAVAGEFRNWTSVYVSLSSPEAHAAVHFNNNMLLYYPERDRDV